MPFSSRVLPSLDLGVLSLSGLVTGPETVEAVRSLYLDDAWTPGGRVLWDGRTISSLDFSPHDANALREALFALRDRIGVTRVALLVSGFDAYLNGLLVAVQSRRSFEREIDVFGDVDAALAWLGIEGLPPELAGFLCR